MQYTSEFINRVKELYPTCEEMHRLADEGNPFLGRWLDDSSSGGFGPDEVLNTPYKKLVEKALAMKKRRELYSDFITGKCHSEENMRKTQCPIMYLQKNNSKDRFAMEKLVCTGVGYVGYYSDCKNWNCKEKCWEKYDNAKPNDKKE